MPIEILAVENGGYATNTYLAYRPGETDAVVIDPGLGIDAVLAALESRRLSPSLLLLTHGHGDHIAGVPALRERFGAPVAAFAAEAPLLARPSLNLTAMVGLPYALDRLDRALADGETFAALGGTWTALLTPGHTAGSGCFLVDGRLFSGDTLFRDGVGRADLPTGDATALARSIRERLYTLPPETVVLPGHGPSTTIERERRMNPFVTAEGLGTPA